MKIPYCLPIVATTKEEVLEIINKNYTQYSFFEVWLDYIQDLDIKFVQNIINIYEDKIIFIFRRQKLSKALMPLKKRLEIIDMLVDKKTMLDLDATQIEELLYVRNKHLSVQLITSYHQYKKTPNNDTLAIIIRTMKEYKPIIYKIATYCQTEDDALRLLRFLLQLKEERIRCIMLGMGTHGAITRIFGTLWGNEMIFAPLTKELETAPDMLTREQLETIFEQLVIRN